MNQAGSLHPPERFLRKFASAVYASKTRPPKDRLCFVDFSEVYAYAYDGDAWEPAWYGVRPEWLFTLATRHLFEAFTVGPVYLLPSHAAELAARVRDADRSANRLRAKVRELHDKLPPSLAEAIKGAIPDAVSTELRNALVGYVLAGRLGDLCTALLREYDVLLNLRVLGDKVRELLRRSRLSIDAPGWDGEPPSFKPAIEDAVYHMFPEPARERNASAKLVDARALLFFEGYVGGRRPSVLVTRDQGMHMVAESMAREYSTWGPVAEALLPIEMVVVDMFVSGMSEAAREEWCTLTYRVLRSLLDQLRFASDVDVASSDAVGMVLRQVRSSFDHYLNLQLAASTDRLPWLRGRFAGGQVRSDDDRMIDKLFRVLSSREVVDDIRGKSDETIAELVAGSRKLTFLSTLGLDGSDLYLDDFSVRVEGPYDAQGAEKVILRTEPYRSVCSIQFRDALFQEKLKELGEHVDVGRLEEVLNLAMVGEGTEPGLLVAFVLAALGRTSSAMRVLTRLVQDYGDADNSSLREVYFLRAVVGRRLCQDANDELCREGLLMAFGDLGVASDLRRKAGPHSRESDPRHLKERATIGLVWWERGFDSESPIPGVTDCLSLLRSALGLITSDSQLRLEVINNIAYVGALSSAPGLDELEGYLPLLEAGLQSYGPWTALEDTILLVRGCIAYARRDEMVLRHCLANLLRLETGTTSTAVKKHRRQVTEWLSALGAVVAR